MAENEIVACNSESNGNYKVGGCTGKGFMPGKSGNPSGRAKMPPELIEAFKAASMPAFETLKSIMEDRLAKDKDRVRCAEIILERAYGKAEQPIDIDGDGLPLIQVTIGGEAADFAK